MRHEFLSPGACTADYRRVTGPGSVRLSALALAEERPMWELAHPAVAVAVAPHRTCAEVDGVLDAAAGVVVVDGDRVGYLSRRRLQHGATARWS